MLQTESESRTLERFSAILAKSLKIEPGEISRETYLDDLGADSLDLLEISLNVESEFAVSLPEENILTTAQKVFGEEMLVEDGLLTTAGKELILARMPEMSPEQLESDPSVKAVEREFLRVGAWLRLIRELSKHTPTTCPDCSGELTFDDIQLKCSGCGRSVSIPSGESLSRRWVEEFYRSRQRGSRTEGQNS